jgi:hypothetical protein
MEAATISRLPAQAPAAAVGQSGPRDHFNLACLLSVARSNGRGTGVTADPSRSRPRLTVNGWWLGYDAVLAMRLAFDEPLVLCSRTIGESWFAVVGRIVASGLPSVYDGMPIRELSLVTLVVARPDPDDEIIATYADPERLAWMHANFTDHGRVASLGGADSYATRLFDYEHSGRDQVGWVIDRLRADPASRSATITTFQPHSDATYIPCVSMLDFWLPDGAVELVVYAHSIDFGAKGHGNLVELASLQRRVADALGVPVGRLVMIIKSAHVYETELSYIEGVLAGGAAGRSDQQFEAEAESQLR